MAASPKVESPRHTLARRHEGEARSAPRCSAQAASRAWEAMVRSVREVLLARAAHRRATSCGAHFHRVITPSRPRYALLQRRTEGECFADSALEQQLR